MYIPVQSEHHGHRSLHSYSRALPFWKVNPEVREWRRSGRETEGRRGEGRRHKIRLIVNTKFLWYNSTQSNHMSASSFSASFTCVECVQSQWVGCTLLAHGSSICPPVCGGPCPLQRRGGRRTGAVNILSTTLPAIWTTSFLC